MKKKTTKLRQTDEIYIPFTSDYGFKATFGNETKTLFLRKALQALIKSPIPIQHVFFDKTDLRGATRKSRSGILDISCVDEQGNQFIVEMQQADFQFFMNRLKFYVCNRFNTMIRAGKYKFDDLKKIYSIAILSKSIFNDSIYHRVGCIRDENGNVMDDQVIYVTVELDKFLLTASEVKTDAEKLIFTMKNLKNYERGSDLIPEFCKEDWLSEALNELDIRQLTPREWELYERLRVEEADELRRREREQQAIENEQKAIKEFRKFKKEIVKSQKEISKIEAEKQKAEAEKEAEKQKTIFRFYEKQSSDFSVIADIFDMKPSEIEKIIKKMKAENQKNKKK